MTLTHDQLTDLNRLYYRVERAAEWLEWFEQLGEREVMARQQEYVDELKRNIMELERRIA